MSDTGHVRYIDKTREYYKGPGYDRPYRWAHFDDIPFTPLARPLAECRVGLITTSEMAPRISSSRGASTRRRCSGWATSC